MPSWAIPCDGSRGEEVWELCVVGMHHLRVVREWKSSQWTELGTMYLFVHFAWKERWSEERVCTKSLFGWVVGLGKDTTEKSKGLRKR